MELIIDLAMLERNEENPFEKIIACVERASLEGKIDDGTKDHILKVTLSTERKLQDLSDKKDHNSEVVMLRALEIAKTMSAVAISDVDSNLISVFKTGLASISKTIDETENLPLSRINRRFDLLSVKKYLESKNLAQVSTTQLKKALNVTLTNFGIIHPVELPIQGIRAILDTEPVDIWDIEFVFKTSGGDNHKPLEFLYQFIEIMNKIEGVNFYLEDIKIGSLKAKIKALYDSAKSKSEVKELLESSRKFAKAKLEKDFVEQEKLRSEKDKIDAEKELLQQQLKENTSLQADYKRALEIQNMESDLRKKQLENLQLELKVLKEARETFAELLAEGYLSQSDFKMLIKGIPFLSMNNGQLLVGDSTDVIDDL